MSAYQESASSVKPQPLIHWHDEMEFISVLSGDMLFYIDNKKVHLGGGDVFVINPRTLHRNITDRAEDYRAYSVLIRPEMLTADENVRDSVLRPLFMEYAAPYYKIPAGPKAEALNALMEQVRLSEMNGLPGAAAERIGWIHVLLARLYRLCPPSPQQKEVQRGDASVQKDMLSYIRSHYGDKIVLDDLARAGKVSRSRCCALFKRYVHQSPIRFLNEYRLEMSRVRLRDTEESIVSIAVSCGFGGQSYFTKMFSQKFGITPSRYRGDVRRAVS